MNADITANVPMVMPIGEEQLKKASETLEKYKAGKANTDTRIRVAEDWWRLRHWDHIDSGKREQFKTTSAHLFNTILNKHADAIQAYPMPNIHPHEESDKAEAKSLSSIIPVILRRNRFEKVYDDVVMRKLISGTGVYSVYWDGSAMNGLGDISINAINPLNIFPEPGVTDIQDGRNLFVVELVDTDLITSAHPELEGKLRASTPLVRAEEFRRDDSLDTSGKSTVIHWYYKKPVNGKMVLHYCKYTDTYVLYASENDNAATDNGQPMSARGFYDHGMYPFVFTSLFPIADSPWGFGYVDIGKNPQERIDRLNHAISVNAMVGATRRYMASNGCKVNEAEFADHTCPIVHVEGMLDDAGIRAIEQPVLPGNYINVLENTINELRDTSGNSEAATGAVPSGVTAASAIAALQQAAGKTSAASTMAEYRAFEQIVIMCIELIRQFYNTVRKFRITGTQGEDLYVEYSNANLKEQQIDIGMGDTGYRVPEFDIDVSAETNSVYTRISQNEMALQLYNAGVFLPENANQALMLLETMDFPRKEELIHRISQNGSLYQQLLYWQQLALGYANKFDPMRADALASAVLQSGGIRTNPISANMTAPGAGAQNPEESPVTRKARQQADEAPMPDA